MQNKSSFFFFSVIKYNSNCSYGAILWPFWIFRNLSSKQNAHAFKCLVHTGELCVGRGCTAPYSAMRLHTTELQDLCVPPQQSYLLLGDDLSSVMIKLKLIYFDLKITELRYWWLETELSDLCHCKQVSAACYEKCYIEVAEP